MHLVHHIFSHALSEINAFQRRYNKKHGVYIYIYILKDIDSVQCKVVDCIQIRYLNDWGFWGYIRFLMICCIETDACIY